MYIWDSNTIMAIEGLFKMICTNNNHKIINNRYHKFIYMHHYSSNTFALNFNRSPNPSVELNRNKPSLIIWTNKIFDSLFISISFSFKSKEKGRKNHNSLIQIQKKKISFGVSVNLFILYYVERVRINTFHTHASARFVKCSFALCCFFLFVLVFIA